MPPHAPLKLRSGTSTELGLRGFIDFCLAPLFSPSLHHGNWSGSQLGFSSRPEFESFCSLQKHICSMREGEIVGVYVLICVKQEHSILKKILKMKMKKSADFRKLCRIIKLFWLLSRLCDFPPWLGFMLQKSSKKPHADPAAEHQQGKQTHSPC